MSDDAAVSDLPAGPGGDGGGGGHGSVTAAADDAWDAVDASIHDLRTPLSAMSGWLEVLEARAGAQPDMAARAMQGLRRAIDQQARLLDDYARVSHVQRQWPPGNARRALTDAVGAALLRLEPEAAARLAPLSAALAPGPHAASSPASRSPQCLDAGERLVDALALLLSLFARGLGAGAQVAVKVEHDRIQLDATGADGDQSALERFCNRPGKAGARAAGVGLAVLWSARTVLARCAVLPQFATGDSAQAFSLRLGAAWPEAGSHDPRRAIPTAPTARVR